jgi:hypothetical protein
MGQAYIMLREAKNICRIVDLKISEEEITWETEAWI